MAGIRRSLLLSALLCIPGNMASHAQDYSPRSFGAWIQELEKEAIADGVAPATAHGALDTAMLDQRIIKFEQRQPEKTKSFNEYAAQMLTKDRIAKGQQFLHEYRGLLNGISQQYGVPPQVIVALWGIESNFGRNKGGYMVVDSLVTLAYGSHRSDFFRKQLIAALHILDRERIESSSLRGSWAGALGQPQFMPTTFLQHAVDYDRSGRRDIWNSLPDVFASTANYLVAEGWTSRMTWGREVRLTRHVPETAVGLDHKKFLAQWRVAGVVTMTREPLPDAPFEASLIQPDGPGGRSFIVYDNYRALMRWNRSTYFATAVGLLADRIGP